MSDRQLRSMKAGAGIVNYSCRPFRKKNGENTITICQLMESLNAVNVPYSIDHYPDLLQILEFLNVYLDFLGVRTTFPKGVTLQYIENAIMNRDKANLYQLMYIFLSLVFKFSVQSMPIAKSSISLKRGHLGSFAKAVTKRIYQCGVHELPCDEFTISEILRLHLLISSAPLEDFNADTNCSNVNIFHEGYNAKQKIAEEFISQHGNIIQELHHTSIFELSSDNLLKIFLCLLNQILTFDLVRTKIEEHYVVSPPNYLGRDGSGRTYWRFNSLSGIYIDCNGNNWKYIDKIDNVYILTEVVKGPLKQNLTLYGSIIIEQIMETANRKQATPKNSVYQFVHFDADDWLQVWENKLCDFHNLIQELGLVCNKPLIDSDLFKQSFLNWKVPINQSTGSVKSIAHRKSYNIEQKLCQSNNITEISFTNEHLELIQELASKLAYTYYSLAVQNMQKQNGLFLSETMFEMFLQVKSVAELYLSFYKLYEDLLACKENCHICHSDRFKRSKACENCGRQVHPVCLQKIPFAVQMSHRLCHICQFRAL